MPTINFSIAGGNDGALQVPVQFTRIGDAGRRSSVALTRGVETTTTAANGTGTIVLNGGIWRMEWFSKGRRSELLLAVPTTGGPFEMGYAALVNETQAQGSSMADGSYVAITEIEDARNMVILGTRVDVLRDGNDDPGTFWADPTYVDDSLNVTGFVDLVGKAFRRVQRV
jgi:hypothetical protein